MRPLSRLPAATELAAAARLRPSRAALGYALFTLVAFLIALALSLPHDLIAARALEAATAGAPLRVTFESASFAFPNGYRLRNLRLVPTRAAEAALSITELTVRVPLLGLLLGRLADATLAGQAWGGRFSGAVQTRGSHAALHLELRAVDLARLATTLIPPPGRLAGQAALDLDLAGDPRSTRGAEGALRLTVHGLALHEIALRGVTLPDLSFPDLELAAQVAGSRLQIQELRANGDELALGAKGDLLLREPLPSSVLNLRLTIDVRPSAPPALRMATALLPPRPAGETPSYALSGTLAAPVLR